MKRRPVSLSFLWFAATLAGCHPFRAEVPEIKSGIASYEKSKFAEAEKAFDQAIVHTPSAAAHFDDGAALARQHQLGEAADQFERSAAAASGRLQPRAYLDLGNAHAQGGQLDPAIDAYRRALEIDPTDPDARYNLEWALLQKKAQEKRKGGQSQKRAKNDQGQKKKSQQGQGQQAKNDQQGKSQQNQAQKKQAQNGAGQHEKKQQQAENGTGQKEAQKQPPQPQPSPAQPAKGQNGQPKPKSPAAMAQAGKGQQKPSQGAEAAPPAKPMTRQSTNEVLDALQAGEKNLQMWRFQVVHRPLRHPGEDW